MRSDVANGDVEDAWALHLESTSKAKTEEGLWATIPNAQPSDPDPVLRPIEPDELKREEQSFEKIFEQDWTNVPDGPLAASPP